MLLKEDSVPYEDDLPRHRLVRKALAAASASLCFAASPAWAGKYASIVIDLDTHKVLHAREADETRYPASLTKVMTLYLVFDALDPGNSSFPTG